MFTIIFVIKKLKGFARNKFGPASQTVAQHYIGIVPMTCNLGSGFSGDGAWKSLTRVAMPQYTSKDRTIAQCCFDDRPASKTRGTCLLGYCCYVYSRSSVEVLVLGQR